MAVREGAMIVHAASHPSGHFVLEQLGCSGKRAAQLQRSGPRWKKVKKITQIRDYRPARDRCQGRSCRNLALQLSSHGPCVAEHRVRSVQWSQRLPEEVRSNQLGGNHALDRAGPTCYPR